MAKLTRLVLAVVAGVGVAPACSEREVVSTPGATVPFTDGTRLKAVHYQIEGAPPFFLSWHDTELGVDCSYLNSGPPDHLVCFPSNDGSSKFAHDAFLFADSNCGVPIVGSYFPGESRYFVGWPEDDTGCGAISRLFQVGDVVPPDAPLYTMDSSTGACLPQSATEPKQYVELRVLGAEIPIDTLVSGTLQHDARPRVVPLAIAGSDGSSQGVIASEVWIIGWDNERREMVSVAPSPPPGARWYPAISYDANYFSDTACTARAAVGFTCGFAAAKEASLSTADACGRTAPTNIFALGPQVSGRPDLYYANANSNNACLQYDGWPVTDTRYATFSLGAAIPLTAFAEAIEVRTGTERLRVVQVGSPDGPAMAGVGLFDSVLGQWCSFALAAADDTFRCLPQTVDTGGYFADEACSVPLVPSLPPDSPCAPRPTFASRDEAAPEPIRQRRHVYPIGEPYAGMVYLRPVPLAGEDCFPIGTVGDSGADQMFTTGPEIPAADFVPMNLVRPK
jgi:hypothetical protein